MRRILIGLVVAAFAALPAATAGAANVPPINCGIVSCTYPVDRLIDRLTEGNPGLEECIDNTLGAVRNVLQGTPQPATCDI